MAFSHGKDTVFLLNAIAVVGGTSDNFEKTADAHDVTTFGKSAHVFQGGLLNGTSSLGGVYDTSTTSGPRFVIEPLVGSNVAFIDRPEGTGSGKPQRSGTVLVTKYAETKPVADMITWSADLQFSDSITNATQT